MDSIHTLRVLGMVSGSSLAGVNAAIITTDGVDVFEFVKTFEIPYDDNLREALRHMRKNFALMNEDEKIRIENAVTEFHIAAAREIICDWGNIDLIGFSGHIICHKPNEHILYQIGNAQKIADDLKVKVVSKFRDADILAGGQGAPLSAIYHASLAQKMDKPVVFVDIGGLTSLTFIGQNGEIFAFDAGPGNSAINDWVNRHSGMNMDFNGRLGITGKINESVLNSMMRHKFLTKQPPKVADANTFKDKLEHLEGLSLEDGAATATAFVADAILKAINDFVVVTPKKIIVCGGGAQNPTLMRFLKLRGKGLDICNASECGYDARGIEAQAFAFIAVRRLQQMPSSFPFTTGAMCEVINGEIFEPKS